MTFDEKLEEQLKKMSLTPVSMTRNREYFYGDFAELVALFANGNYFTCADLIDRFNDFNVSIRSRRAEAYDEMGNELDIEIDDGMGSELANELGNTEDGVIDDEIASSQAERVDEKETWATSVFAILQKRYEIYGADYPFEVDDKKLRLNQPVTARQQIYLMLLLAANLNYFEHLQPTLTSEFEQVAFEVLKRFLPKHAIVKQFGKNSDYEGTAREKISALARDLKVKTRESEIATILGSQKRGLDVVGWLPFQDAYANVLSVFGQCACGKDWYRKQNETRRFNSSYYLFEKLDPIHAMFVPAALNRKTTIYQSDEIIGGTLLFRAQTNSRVHRRYEFF